MSPPPHAPADLAERADELAALIASSGIELVALYVFGSVASGDARPGSDVDLALLGREPLTGEQRFELRQALEEALARDVDLVDMRRAPTVLQLQVVTKGRLLAERDRTERVIFEDFVFSSYARLNEERREILEQVFRDRQVYGG